MITEIIEIMTIKLLFTNKFKNNNIKTHGSDKLLFILSNILYFDNTFNLFLKIQPNIW